MRVTNSPKKIRLRFGRGGFCMGFKGSAQNTPVRGPAYFGLNEEESDGVQPPVVAPPSAIKVVPVIKAADSVAR